MLKLKILETPLQFKYIVLTNKVVINIIYSFLETLYSIVQTLTTGMKPHECPLLSLTTILLQTNKFQQK